MLRSRRPDGELLNPAGEAPERLFRDDAGAALERIVRLEEENAALRAEIERLKLPARDGNTVRINRSTSPVVAIGVTVAGAVLGVLLAYRFAAPPRHSDWADLPPPVVTPASIATYVPMPTTPIVYAPAPATDSCAVPYWYDGAGAKHYKLQCATK